MKRGKRSRGRKGKGKAHVRPAPDSMALGGSSSSIGPRVKESWRQETRRRVAEIKGGRAKAIPLDDALAEGRKVVDLEAAPSTKALDAKLAISRAAETTYKAFKLLEAEFDHGKGSATAAAKKFRTSLAALIHARLGRILTTHELADWVDAEVAFWLERIRQAKRDKTRNDQGKATAARNVRTSKWRWYSG